MTYLPAPRPLPLQPVLPWVVRVLERTDRRNLEQLPSLAEWLGVALGSPTRSAAKRRGERIKVAGALTVWEADRVAVALGLHPCLIWGEAWWDARGEPDAADRAFRVLREQVA